MLKKVIQKMKIKEFSEGEINHALSIILRLWNEINYMKLKNNIHSFELVQMNHFKVSFYNNYINIIVHRNKCKISVFDLDILVEEIYGYFSKRYPINYDYKLIDPIYFSLFFYDVIPKIEKTMYDFINIGDIRLLRKNSNCVTMNESESFNALKKNLHHTYTPFQSNHIIDSDTDRLNNALISIRDNGYGYNSQYAIFYNDEPYIRDGQHRLAAVKFLYGDINVKIVRFLLKDNYFYD